MNQMTESTVQSAQSESAAHLPHNNLFCPSLHPVDDDDDNNNNLGSASTQDAVYFTLFSFSFSSSSFNVEPCCLNINDLCSVTFTVCLQIW